jgi:hypothetical protein
MRKLFRVITIIAITLSLFGLYFYPLANTQGSNHDTAWKIIIKVIIKGRFDFI